MRRDLSFLPWKKIAKEYGRGESLQALAEKYGVPKVSLRRRLKRMEVRMRPRGRPPAQTKEWVKIQTRPNMSAAIHLPWALLVRLGFRRGDRLEGKWEVRRGLLLLRVRRRGWGRWRR
jgi:hypothetical protein